MFNHCLAYVLSTPIDKHKLSDHDISARTGSASSEGVLKKTTSTEAKTSKWVALLVTCGCGIPCGSDGNNRL